MIKKSRMLRVITVLFTALPCYSFVPQRAVQDAPTVQPAKTKSKSKSINVSRNAGHSVQLSKRPDDAMPIMIPAIIYKLNSSTKWIVTFATIVAVWSHPQNFFGPFIMVGSIAAVYLTVVLKNVIQQDRPEGAPFADPGMPSSHSLVSFFLAVAWKSHLVASASYDGMILVAAAMAVATLRVICGYHTIPQIAVGAVLGSGMGYGWFSLGKIFHAYNPKLAFALVWSVYLGLSAIYIQRDIRKWITEHKHL
jgi:membrane-associated phospholipid phosphatase